MSNEYILTSCTHYGPDRIVHFLRSYSKYCKDVSLIVFGGQLPESSVVAIESVGGTFVDVTGHYNRITPFTLRLVKRFRRLHSLAWFYRSYRLASFIDRKRFGTSNGLQYHVTGVQALRYMEYLSYVNKISDESRVFITDIRDVIFQTTPFNSEVVGLELYQEENNLIGNCEYNYPWLEHAIGHARAKKFRTKPVLCSGTTTGDVAAMRGYLRVMSRFINDNALPLGPIDQAYHNYAFYSGKLAESKPTVYENRFGRVQTMATQGAYELHEGFIVNHDQKVVPVVHQWDRYESLKPWADAHCGINQ